MKLRVIQEWKGCRALWTDKGHVLLARGMRFYGADSELEDTKRDVSLGGIVERTVSCSRLFRQLLRLGIHHLWPLGGGCFLAVIRKRVLRIDEKGRSEVVLFLPRGNKPAHKGVCITPRGTVFLGEYSMNMKRELPSFLYRSCDGGRTFLPIREFRPNEVRHIHFVQWDEFGQCLWMGTGDRDEECWIFRSDDEGETWIKVGGGSQLWRAVGVAFRPEALYWGTDAGSDAGTHPNHIMRLDRMSLKLQKVFEVQGPCHGCATLKDGTLLVSTGVEGGVNEKDRCAHLWASREGVEWQEVACFRKDPMPLILQYGVIRFPQGLVSDRLVIFTCLGLVGAGETTFVAELIDEHDTHVLRKESEV
jgi:hypothetical protein